MQKQKTFQLEMDYSFRNNFHGFRYQCRGYYTEKDDPGLQLRMEQPQILKTLAIGTVFDLSLTEKIKLIICLLDQISMYAVVRDSMEESFEIFRQSRGNLRTLQAAEKRKDSEDNLWK